MKLRELIVMEDGEGGGATVGATTSSDIATVAYPLFVRGRSKKDKRKNARAAVGQKYVPGPKGIGTGVFENSLNEFAPGAGDEGGGEDPYKYPKPASYRRSIDFFGQFEADHFDREDMNDATGEFKGYWGKTQIAYFKFDNPARTGSDDPGMGWYYEPTTAGNNNDTEAKPAVDTSAQRKQQELGMIRAFLKSGNRPNPDSQIGRLMKKHGLAEGNEWQGNRGNSQAGITDHTFDEAKQYIKGNYPFHKTYNVSRVEPGMRYHANPEKVANKTQSLVKGIDSALDYLQVKQNPMMSGSTQVTPSIGYSWHTHESRANGIAVLYYEDRGMGNDTITIAAKDRNNLKGAVQVCRDAGVIPLPKVKEQGVAESKLIESAVFLNPTTVIVGQAHGQPLELSPNTLKQIQALAAKHGAYYEGNGTDRAYTKGQIDRYVGSWDDEVAKTASPNDPKWLYVLFANVDANNRVQRVGVDPKDTIFNRLLATAQDNSFQGIGYTAQALQKFLQMASEGKYDFVKMSQQPATQENLTRFLKTGEALMWPNNWEQYPNKAGKIAKAATVDVRDQYLATRKAGVYVTGSGHLKAVQNITGKQGVAENFAEAHVVGNDSVIYRLDRENPMSDTEVLVLGGAGRYSLKALRDKARREAAELAQDLSIEHGGAFRRSATNIKQLTNTINTIVAAYNELARLRRKGGRGSRGITDEDANFIRECIRVVEQAAKNYRLMENLKIGNSQYKGTKK